MEHLTPNDRCTLLFRDRDGQRQRAFATYHGQAGGKMHFAFAFSNRGEPKWKKKYWNHLIIKSFDEVKLSVFKGEAKAPKPGETEAPLAYVNENLEVERLRGDLRYHPGFRSTPVERSKMTKQERFADTSRNCRRGPICQPVMVIMEDGFVRFCSSNSGADRYLNRRIGTINGHLLYGKPLPPNVKAIRRIPW